MKILITGGSGTIGGYVTRELLKAGHAVVCYSRTAPRVAGVGFVEGDIKDPDGLAAACRDRQVVIHLAAVPGPGRVSPADLIDVNVTGTVHALEAAVQSGVRQFVFASSAAATGFTFPKRPLIPQYLPLDEAHPCEPHDEYGLSKLLAELACKRYSDAYGLRTICLRINSNWYLDRAGAEVAVQSGWAQGLTVEDLWTQRYRKTLEYAGGNWPSPGPPTPEKALWAFTDARDMAIAFRLAVENNDIEHEVLLINGHDTCSRIESRELVARYFPDVPLTSPLDGYASLWSHAKATRVLGYQPQYTWRESDFGVWLDGRTDT